MARTPAVLILLALVPAFSGCGHAWIVERRSDGRGIIGYDDDEKASALIPCERYEIVRDVLRSSSDIIPLTLPDSTTSYVSTSRGSALVTTYGTRTQYIPTTRYWREAEYRCLDKRSVESGIDLEKELEIANSMARQSQRLKLKE